MSTEAGQDMTLYLTINMASGGIPSTSANAMPMGTHISMMLGQDQKMHLSWCMTGMCLPMRVLCRWDLVDFVLERSDDAA